MSQYVSTVKGFAPVQSGKKFFTLAEAQKSLPLIRRIAADVQATQSVRLRLYAQLNAVHVELSANHQRILAREFEKATARLEQLMEELWKLGVELKDPSRALMDFPCRHQGREVLLCWKAGELTVSYFHEIDDGYAGRKPVSLLQN